ncbi:MAG: hypothetical protein R2822_00215 [Spirosomataceae bacterium]
MPPTRRQFIHSLVGTTAATWLAPTLAEAAAYPMPIASNGYNWTTFYGRQKKNWGKIGMPAWPSTPKRA